jgi:hypothetical protein
MGQPSEESGHEPPPHFPDLHDGANPQELSRLGAVLAEKTESCFSGLVAPHSGQAGAGEERLRCRCSKATPHLRQTYS